MKFYWKVFLSIFILMSLSFGVCGTLMIHMAFYSAYEREIALGNTEHDLYRMTFKTSVEAVPVSYFLKNQGIVPKISESILSGTGKQPGELRVWRAGAGAPECVFPGADKEESVPALFSRLNETTGGYEVYRENNRYLLRVASVASISNTGESYYLESLTDITPIYDERQEMIQNFRMIVVVLLAMTACVSMLLSHFLTRRIRALSHHTRQFADGEYEVRVRVSGQDEVAVLAEDFNRMADSLTEKMEDLKLQKENQEAFTSAFAHELKTPLTAIIGYADMLRSVELGPEEKMKAAGYIYSQGKRLESLSFKLLELFVLKKQQLVFQEIDAGFLIQSVFDLTEVAVLNHDMTLKKRVEAGRIYGEKDLLISLFANLVDNARKASKKGDTILICGKNVEKGYQVQICDEGKGIPRDSLGKLTEAFYMVDKSRSRKEGGAGLGMTLCHEIVKLHHANWKIESKEGDGTTVTVVLPEFSQK